MKIKKCLTIFTLVLISVGASENLYANDMPPVSVLESGKRISSKSDISEQLKNVESKLQKIVAEMTSEQERHQERVGNIENELRQLESSLNVKLQASQEKPWMPARIAMVLDQDSK